MAHTTEELGRLIARAHYQAWRLDAPPFDLTPEELAAILPNLIRSGSAGIVWHRVKPFREKYGAMVYALEAATNAQIAHNQRVEEAVVECVTRLRAYGIEPVLVKGLALAKLYPEGIVRPAGDIDLVVRKEEFAAAHAILHDTTKPAIPINIDLHRDEPSPPDEGAWDEVPNHDFWARLSILYIEGQPVSTLKLPDNLKMVCRHFMKHGGSRPVWMCDYSTLVEMQNATSHLEVFAEEIGIWEPALAAAARELLGLELSQPGLAPAWFVVSTMDQWVNPRQTIRLPATITLLHSPEMLSKLLAESWPTPIAAAFWQDSRVDETSPVCLQISEMSSRVARHLKYRVHRQLRQVVLGTSVI